jgi:CRP-like cAMP-binding protein
MIEIRDELVRGTFLASLDAEQRAELQELGIRREFPRGSILMFERERDTRVVFLLGGRVKVAHIDHDGRELVLDIGDPGDVLGELAFIDAQPRMATVTALELVDAVVVGGDAFRSHLDARPGVMAVLTEVMSRRFRQAQLKRSQFSTLDTMGRLAARLVELADRYGEPTKSGIQVLVPLSHEELAAWTGASRAGVSQALQIFREFGWLVSSRRELLIRDLDALRARGADT